MRYNTCVNGIVDVSDCTRKIRYVVKQNNNLKNIRADIFKEKNEKLYIYIDRCVKKRHKIAGICRQVSNGKKEG